MVVEAFVVVRYLVCEVKVILPLGGSWQFYCTIDFEG